MVRLAGFERYNLSLFFNFLKQLIFRPTTSLQPKPDLNRREGLIDVGL